MTDKEAMKLALDALECANSPNGDYENEIAALKERLAQPEQEQQIETLKRCLFQMQEAAKDLVEQAKSLTPPQRTEQERDEILQAITDPENQPSQFGTVTLEYHQEKMKQWEDLFDRMSANFERASDKAIAQRIVPLYTISPQRTEQEPVIDKSAAIRIATALGWEPKREWVDLTAEEVLQCWGRAHEPGNKEHINAIRMADEVEAKLKEVNT